MPYLGIDWSEDKHDLCLLADDGRVLSERWITNDASGFADIGKLVKDIQPLAVNLERPDGLLVNWLMSQGYQVYVTAPSIVASKRPRRSKDDRGDAYLLASLLRDRNSECRILNRQSETVIHLRQLLKAYDNIVQEQRRETNRLVWLLRQYYPGVLQAFVSRYSHTFFAFLETFPTPAAARVLTADELRTFLKSHGYTQLHRLPIMFSALQALFPTAWGEAGYVEVVHLLIPRLRCLAQQRDALEKRVEVVFTSHPEASWWRSFPLGGGPLTPARLLAEIGDDRQRFPSPQVLQAIAGTAPVTRRSNRKIQVEFRQACSHGLRKAAFDFAKQSIKHSGWARAYFYDQCGRGHSKSRAYRALGNRWLAIVWKLWQTKVPYDEAFHVANRARRGLPRLTLVPDIAAAAD